MTHTVTVGNVTLGEGRPKIIVPLVGKTADSILEAAEQARDLDCDLIEWRIDFYEEVATPQKVAALSSSQTGCSKTALGDFPEQKRRWRVGAS